VSTGWLRTRLLLADLCWQVARSGGSFAAAYLAAALGGDLGTSILGSSNLVASILLVAILGGGSWRQQFGGGDSWRQRLLVAVILVAAIWWW